ncbi:cell surface protein [Eubacterium limosum]|nr:cell surface protein [Eubacterium limosum]
MRNKRIGKQALSILLCALVVFSSLGISPLTPQAQAEEAAAVSLNPDGTTATDWSQIPTTNWNETANIDIAWYTDHAGDSVFTLSTPEELAGMMALSKTLDTGNVTDKNGKTYAGSQTFSGKTINLGSDMDLGAHVWQGINDFQGTFDGQGYVISNVWMNSSYSGFFNKGTSCTLKNIIIDQSHYSLCGFSGALIGLGNGKVQILNCKVANTEIRISGDTQSRIGGIAGQINTAGGVINNCTTENVWIKNDGTTTQIRHVALIASVFSGERIINCTVSGGGILLDDTGNNHNYELLYVGSIYANLDTAAKLATGNTSSATIQVKGMTRTQNGQKAINIGGLYGSISTSTTYSCFTGTIEVEGCTTNNLYVGGLAGTIDSGKSVSNCYNAGSITVKDSKSNNSIDLSQNVAGVVGNLAGNMSACYNAGTITGLGSNATSAFGGLTGRIGGSIADCFYINAVKASGDDKNAGAAINLASIQDTSGNVISQIKQGDDTAKVVLADATQLSALQKADALGVSFGIQMPTASAFSSDKPEAVQAVVGSGNTVNLKTSGGAGGQAAISAKMYLNQNELATDASGVRKFTGPVKSVEAPIILNLNVVNVGLANQSPTSAIGDVTSFSLKAGVTFGGTNVSKDTYSLKWYKNNADQSATPTGDGTEVTGLTETWNDAANTVSWTRPAPAATFAESDAGWYKLKATSAVSGLSAYSFETDWQYLSVDKFMVVDENSTMPDTVELSSQDTDADIQDKTKLSVQIEIAAGFTGSITYGWYKVDGQTPALVANTKETTTEITADIATHTIAEEITLGTAYSDGLKGAYQLRVTSVTATGSTAQEKDIRGPASKVTCYQAVIKDDYAQAGPGYEGTPGNTMTQSVITLSEDFADAMYDAYWIKGGTLSESTDLTDYTKVRHATLTQQADKTYKAIATFNMEKGYEGEDYQLVIYPTNTTRKARTDTAMQFKGASGCVLERYAIDTVTYKLADSYATTEMAQDNAITAAPTVSAPNPSGSLTYTKVSGPETFTVDKTSGKILCAAVPKDIPNGLYTYTIKVTEEGFKNDTGAVLTGPGMSKTITVSFRVTGSSDFPLANNNLYIYDIGYIFANAEPVNQAGLIPYQGIYNIPANNGSAYTHSITVVSGTHTDGSRIILNESINTADVPITVEAGATAQVGVPDSKNLTLTNSQNGASLQSDGSLMLTGGTAGTGSLTLPGKATGNGSLTIGAADTKGLTLNAAADLATASATIESGLTTVAGSITGKATIKGGNVKATAIGTAGTTIDGGSIIGSVTGEVKNSDQERVYPVTLKLSATPAGYAGVPASVTTQITKADGKADGTAKTWNAQASDNSFNQNNGSGELYVYLPKYSGGPYTAVTASATPAGGTAQTLSRKINADANGSLSASLLTATYTLSLPKAPITGSAKVGQGATAPITVGVASNDGWLYEGRTIDLEISPGDGYKTIWGKYQMQPADTTAQGSYSPEFWIQTPSGAALSKAGSFATLTDQDRKNGKTGQLVVPADSKITEGTYKSQLNWKSIPNDPVVGGTN